MGTEIRLAGRITEWNDDKGFGFVVPNGGGERCFIHISGFERGSRRPVPGDLISYLPSKDQRGRINARQIRHASRKVEAPRAPRQVPRMAIGIGALGLAAALAAGGIIPAVMAGVYFCLSIFCYLLYWVDKSAARRGGRRTPESTLQLVGLLGGWPGALVAQQYFRHKTIKQPFQAVFWSTVLFNLATGAWLVWSGIAAELARLGQG